MNDLIKEADYILTDPDFNMQPNAASLIRKLRDELKKYQWRPIEEAPKDGTVILATNGYMTWTVVWTSYDAIRQDYGCGRWGSCLHGYDCDADSFDSDEKGSQPTHFMPLPKPPDDSK